MKTETEQKATPRPWEIISGNDNAVHIVHGPGEIATVFKWDSFNGATPESQKEEAEANAALIVKAVNAYDADQEIIRELVEVAKHALETVEDYVVNGDRMETAIELRKVIAKAAALHV